jgi:hypothetical protein
MGKRGPKPKLEKVVVSKSVYHCEAVELNNVIKQNALMNKMSNGGYCYVDCTPAGAGQAVMRFARRPEISGISNR